MALSLLAAAGVADRISDGSLTIALMLALAAGLVSFLSPCVLPLVPGYLSFVTGMSAAELRDPDSSLARRGRLLAASLLFVLGFSVVFVSFGALFGGAGSLLRSHQESLARVLGALTIVLGLVFMGALERLPFAHRQLRIQAVPAAGLVGAPLLGVLFGLGWSPCIGPTLSAVLGLAASTNDATAARGAVLSLAYCFGLGAPFVVAGLAFRRSMSAFETVRRHYRVVMVGGGLLLVIIGVLEVVGTWGHLVSRLQSQFGGFTTLL